MSSGQQAWRDEAEQEAFDDAANRVAAINKHEMVTKLKTVLSSLQYMDDGRLVLTRNGWARYNSATQILTDILNGK